MDFLNFMKKSKKIKKLDLPPINADAKGFKIPKPPLLSADIPEPPSLGQSLGSPLPFDTSNSFSSSVPDIPSSTRTVDMPPDPDQDYLSQDIPKIDDFPKELPPLRTTAPSELSKHSMDRKYGHDIAGPIFIRVDHFKKTSSNINMMLTNLGDFTSVSRKLKAINNNLDNLINTAQSEMEDIQRKLVFIERTIFEDFV